MRSKFYVFFVGLFLFISSACFAQVQNLEMRVFGVGQANFIILKSTNTNTTNKHKYLVVDCGYNLYSFVPSNYFPSSVNAGNAFMDGFLEGLTLEDSKFSNIKLVVTHEHADHTNLIGSFITHLVKSYNNKNPRNTITDNQNVLPRVKAWSVQDMNTFLTDALGTGVTIQSFVPPQKITGCYEYVTQTEATQPKNVKSGVIQHNVGYEGGIFKISGNQNYAFKYESKKNSFSAVLFITFAGKKIVLPGDASLWTLTQMQQQSQTLLTSLQNAHILVASHHGSARGKNRKNNYVQQQTSQTSSQTSPKSWIDFEKHIDAFQHECSYIWTDEFLKNQTDHTHTHTYIAPSVQQQNNKKVVIVPNSDGGVYDNDYKIVGCYYNYSKNPILHYLTGKGNNYTTYVKVKIDSSGNITVETQGNAVKKN